MALSRTFARLSILALLTSLFFAPPLTASASGTCDVNDYGDTAGTSSVRTLRYCIANVGDDGTITFDTATAETITVSTSALLIERGGITIDGGGLITLTTTAPSTSTTYESSPTSYPLVTVDLTSNTSATTTFIGLTFDGATNGSSTINGAAVTGSMEGGAINAARAVSGKLYGFNVTIEDSDFNFNRSGNGGAVAANSLIVTNSNFVGNRATGGYGGGALMANEATIRNSYFDSNTAPSAGTNTGGGGAVYVFKFIDVDSSSFTNNSTFPRGGAIFDDQAMSSQRQPSKISNSFFDSNSTGIPGNSFSAGGAVWLDPLSNGVLPIIENSTFLNNLSGQQGGAIAATNGALVTLSTFQGNSTDDDFNGQSIYANSGKLYLLGNLFLDQTSTAKQVHPRSGQATVDDGGANVSTGAATTEPFGSESTDGFDFTTLGVDVSSIATASKSVQPFLPVGDLSATSIEVTQAMAAAIIGRYLTDINASAQSDPNNPVVYSLPTTDQQGNVRTLPMYPGAEFGTSAPPPAPPSSSSAPAPYTGPLVTSIGSQQSAGAFQTTSSATVTVYGERLSGVSKVFIEGKEAVISSISNDSFVMTLPAGLSDGVHDLVIQSSLGNLTYLDGISIAGETVEVFSYGEVSAWTSRISDTQLKVYVKFPTVGEKVRISHQTGGTGSYETVYVRTTSSETMEGLRIVEGVGTYVVRTIDLEEINRIRVTVGDEELVQVRYNN
jgi:predicted outer membrane repeat protein